MTSIWPFSVSMTGILTGELGGCSSGLRLRGSTSGSGSSGIILQGLEPSEREAMERAERAPNVARWGAKAEACWARARDAMATMAGTFMVLGESGEYVR